MKDLLLNEFTPIILMLLYLILYKIFVCNLNSITDDSLTKQKYGENYKNKI